MTGARTKLADQGMELNVPEKRDGPTASLVADQNLLDYPKMSTPSSSILASTVDKTSEGGKFGPSCFTPSWLQLFNTPKWFLFFLCLFVMCQSMTVSGMNGVVIPTVEKRYQLSSERSGFITSAYEIGVALFILPVSYFGERAHKPRWLGIGCLLQGIGAMMFALPQFIGGKYVADHVQDMESCAAGVNHSLYASECSTGVPAAYTLLVLGQCLIGVGVLPLYTVGITFLDEIAGPDTVHYFIGIFYTFAAIGPAIGYLLGSVFLSQYVDLSVTDHPDPDDPNFVGRWWAGYVLAWIALTVLSLPLLMYPQQLPNTAWIMEEKRKTQLGTGKSSGSGHPEFGRTRANDTKETGFVAQVNYLIGEMWVMLKAITALVLSPVLLTNTLGDSTESFAVSGIIPFITKYFTSQFGVTASTASALTGAASVVGAAGGILFSSWLMKYRKVTGPRLAKYTAGIALVAVFFVPAFLVRCDSVPIVGVTRPYPGNSVSGANRCNLNYTHSCVSSCGCVSERYDPVCGNDGFTYPTPCLAGCQAFRNATSGKTSERTYVNCSCIALNLDSSTGGGGGYSAVNGTASLGTCKISCSRLPLFVVLLSGLMFFTFMNNVPSIEVMLQCVPADRRTLATGVQWLIIRIIGNVPGPVFYGYLLDKGCRLWHLNCCTEGNCWEYDNVHMSNSMFAASMGCKVLSFGAFFLSWRLFVRDKNWLGHAKNQKSTFGSTSD